MDELIKESILEACVNLGFPDSAEPIIKLLEKKILGELSHKEVSSKLEDIYEILMEN